MKSQIKIISLLLLFTTVVSCKKLVEIPEPINTITTKEAYSNDKTAISTVLGIYNYMSWNTNLISYANGGITINLGMASDELNSFNGNSTFQTNTLQSDDGDVYNLWSTAYFSIYMANAAIEGLNASKNATPAVKNQITGEAKFIRAFSHFYLVNLFGDVPLTTSTSYTVNSKLQRSPSSEVYQQIIQDLKDAQSLLSDKYARPDGGYYSVDSARIRPNKSAAIALLARIYLYTQKYDSAETEASLVINNSSVYSLETDLNHVFLASNASNINTEAIWQLQVADAGSYSTLEGNTFVPFDNQTTPNYFLNQALLNAFEPGDQRAAKWVGLTSPNINGVPTDYYYPAKFKVLQGSPGNVTEYYTPLRLAEQYLIRAEARAKQNHPDMAVNDLNVIRRRAGLAPLSISLSQTQVLSAIAQENRIEFFAEWGHRWFDLKRTNQLDAVISNLKPTWQPYANLLPIPLSELQKNLSLNQNPGYQ